MKMLKNVFTMAALIGLLVFSGSALAAKPSGAGGGGAAESPDLGDLFVLLRDADGVPKLTTDSCQQPLAAPGVALPAVGSYNVCEPKSETESCVIPVDSATCAIMPGYESYTQEVDFGRTNVARSPSSVLDQQLEDVLIKLSTADCVTRDAAGRLVTSTVADNNDVSSAAIDSPLQNLAIYKQLMLTGSLGVALPEGANPLDIAAVALGAASDKTGKVSVDMLAYLNQILGLTDESVTPFLPKTCINVRAEVNGVVQTVCKCFLNYGTTGGNYSYNRRVNFNALPNPAYIPEGNARLGYTEYLDVLDITSPTFKISRGPTLDAVPELKHSKDLTASSIEGFAQAADDARAVIEFLHSWALPNIYATALTCRASGITTYDVSISDISGLQVPKIIVDGSEGREFTVAVSNSGPDAATGTVTVTATAANGGTIDGSPWNFTFTNLAAGATDSFTQLFTINLGGVTTISWKATLAAPDDVNAGNNEVTATSSIKATGSGGGGRR